jgi:tRNA-2-methylthio-N6-dimethylallyladenosine synthase
MVEGYQSARDQVTGRTSQNKTLNFTVPKDMTAPKVGGYAQVRVVHSHPNSLVGEMVSATEAQGSQPVYSVI